MPGCSRWSTVSTACPTVGKPHYRRRPQRAGHHRHHDERAHGKGRPRAVRKELGNDKPVVAVIYTHTHFDHYAGVKGVVDEADVASGKVPIVAPGTI